jgi:hypothetical protein
VQQSEAVLQFLSIEFVAALWRELHEKAFMRQAAAPYRNQKIAISRSAREMAR